MAVSANARPRRRTDLLFSPHFQVKRRVDANAPVFPMNRPRLGLLVRV